ncbi:MAG: phospholipid carrier-dependent glycosyltransferase [Candidatus Wildermuthbacteria bacterium]|nr:phospholipid carrier-dependent glycosyltransferase [Candidatus Wildermuthbacteria bacterium]
MLLQLASKAISTKFLLGVFAFSLLAHIILFNFPSQVVFDEIHFGTFVRSYTTGEYYFDIHPPLGKLLIAGTAELGGIQLPSDLTRIGQPYEPKDLFFLRIFPLLTGILLPLLIYLLALELTKSTWTAFLAGCMVAFENALLLQSRFAFLDIPLLFFGFAALFAFLRQEHTRNIRIKLLLLLAAGFLFGASYSIKWTALALLVPLSIIALYSFWQSRSLKWFAVKIGIILTASLAVYVLSFAIHFALLTQPGPGDAFFETGFRQKPFFEKFLSLNKVMYSSNKSIQTQHPYQSSWYQWPLNQKPIFYWDFIMPESERQEAAQRLQELTLQLQSNPQNIGEISAEISHLQTEITSWQGKRQIWLLGNPIVWFASLLSLVGGIVLLFAKVFTKRPRDISALLLFVLLLSWLTSYAPFALINRPLFLYHYFFPLLFSILLASYSISWLIKKLIPSRYQLTTVLLFSGIIALGFLLVSPVTYGLVFAPEGWYSQTILKLFL